MYIQIKMLLEYKEDYPDIAHTVGMAVTFNLTKTFLVDAKS